MCAKKTMPVISATNANSNWTIPIRRTLYIVFCAIFFFEFLNYFGVLHFHVDYTWFGRILSTLTVFGALRLIDELFRRKTGKPLSSKIWVVMAILLLFDFIGDVFGFYGRWEHYDQVVHFISGPMLTLCLLLAFERLAKYFAWNCPRAVTYGLALGVNVILAVLYEIEEYSEDVIYHTHRLGDGPDTANDLLMNLVGASLLILGLIVYRAWRKRRQLNQVV